MELFVIKMQIAWPGDIASSNFVYNNLYSVSLSALWITLSTSPYDRTAIGSNRGIGVTQEGE